MTDSLQFQRIGSIPTLPGYALVTKSVANDQTLLFLFAEQSGLAAVKEAIQRGTASFPKTRADIKSRWRLVKMTSGSSQVIDLGVLDVIFPNIDLFPDGRVLIVEPRCFWRSADDYDLNGIVFDPRHGRSTRILLGDGIGGAHVDGLGRIWVGYTDEGIFGNCGWGGLEGPRPTGSAGLVCFSDTGEKIWEYPDNADHEISDCYALNVSGTEATAFFYDDFPLCRVASDFALHYWKTELLGCHVLAISETEALFSGQYDDPSHLGYRCILGSDRIEQVRQTTFLLSDGSNLGEGLLRGRGKYLYFFDETCVYRASLD